MESAVKSEQPSDRLGDIRREILSRFRKDKSPKHLLLEQAFDDAEYYHRNQMRKSGDPAIIHPFRVALLVSEAGMDVEAVIIALLHDVIEDTEVTKEEVSGKYGEWLAEVVDGLTKVAHSQTESGGGRSSIETYRKLLTSTVKDLRTLLVKIFDRLDNMRDLSFLDRARQRRISTETMIVYVPMAQRLGLKDISDELSTLSFRYLYPKRFGEVLRQLKKRIGDDRKKIKGIEKLLASAVRKLEPDFTIQPTYYSVIDYIYERKIKVDKALVGFTVCAASAEACYSVMGALHRSYRVAPNSIRDYISNPKPNRYRGLESKIFIGGEPVLIEIFSREMEKVNRMGILAEWRSSREEISKYYESYLELLEQFAGDEDLRMEDVLRHGQMDTMQIFTPVGEVLSFPQKATVLDFAFAIHTDLGIHCEGAMVDNRRISRFEELRDGVMVEVLTAQHTVPNAIWLGHVRTTRAKLAIRRFIKTQRLERAEEVGKSLFDADLKRLESDPGSFLDKPEFKKALSSRKLNRKQFFQQVGTSKVEVRQFLADHHLVPDKILERLEPESPTGLMRYLKFRSKLPDPDLRISEIGDDFLRLAPCCSPLQGDDIMGVQQETGIIVHRRNCRVLDSANPGTLVSVGWEKSTKRNPQRFTVMVTDRPGQLYKIGKIMRDLKVNIHDLTVERMEGQDNAQIHLLVEPIPAATYQKIVSKLRSIKGVVKIT